MIKKAQITIGVIGAVYAVLTLFCLLKPADEYSAAERRRLAQKPEFSWEQLVSGKYTEQMEEYVTDQFPLRDQMRSLKANFSLKVMKKLDTNEIYLKDGYLCAMEYPMDESSLTRAAEIFEGIYDRYLKGSEASVYFSVVPDKSYFLAEDIYLSMDYDDFFEKMYGQTEFMTSIPIENCLQITDYYRTDTHWRQEKIITVAEQIAAKMGVSISGEYTVHTLEEPFYGVYYGQAAVSAEPDEIKYCTNDRLEQCVVFDYENNKPIELYDTSKAAGRDPYEMFLGGNISLAVIENPAATSSKELVVFGDSFSRSLVPLLAEAYSRTTLIDIRYLPSSYVGNYVTFTNQDVLFLYSTSVLNNSITLK